MQNSKINNVQPEQQYNSEPIADGNSSAQVAQSPMLAAVIPYQLCPKCQGQGIVAKPSWVAAGVDNWSSTSAVHQCDVCNGQKIIPMFVLPKEVKSISPQKESKKSYELKIGDIVTPTEIIEPFRKCLTMGNNYMIINFDFDHKERRVKFQIVDDNGNKKWYRLDTFHRRWRSV